jgi:hypothetical protein
LELFVISLQDGQASASYRCLSNPPFGTVLSYCVLLSSRSLPVYQSDRIPRGDSLSSEQERFGDEPDVSSLKAGLSAVILEGTHNWYGGIACIKGRERRKVSDSKVGEDTGQGVSMQGSHDFLNGLRWIYDAIREVR